MSYIIIKLYRSKVLKMRRIWRKQINTTHTYIYKNSIYLYTYFMYIYICTYIYSYYTSTKCKSNKCVFLCVIISNSRSEFTFYPIRNVRTECDKNMMLILWISHDQFLFNWMLNKHRDKKYFLLYWLQK